MGNDPYEGMAVDFFKESRRLAPRVLFFALILLMSHVLTIEPSNVDAGGIKIAVNDVAVIQGGIALVFYFQLWLMVTNWMEGTFSLPMTTSNRFTKNLIRGVKKQQISEKRKKGKKLNYKEVKSNVRFILFLYKAITAPFILSCMTIIMISMVVGFGDMIKFASFLYDHLSNIYAVSS
jgi:hypothetical protein